MEVGRCRSTRDAAEQRNPYFDGGSGGKDTGQEERWRGSQHPETEPAQLVSFGFEGVRTRAKTDKTCCFTALLHHITPELLRQSFYELNREAMPGIDGVTWQDYEKQLEERLPNLHTEIHKGSYRAKPVQGETRVRSCEEDTYFLKLVSYIHHNPLRAKLVKANLKLYTSSCSYQFTSLDKQLYGNASVFFFYRIISIAKLFLIYKMDYLTMT